jgi:hypothetical protein
MAKGKPKFSSFYFSLRMLVEHNTFICSFMWYQSDFYAILLSIKCFVESSIFLCEHNLFII